jgi:hypothetical protein
VNGSTTGNLKTACDYVHHNPGHARFLTRSNRRPVAWMAQNLSLGAPGSLANGLRKNRQ